MKKSSEYDSYTRDSIRTPQIKNEDDFIIKSKLNRPSSGSNTSLNTLPKSTRFSSTSTISRKSVADMPEPKSSYSKLTHKVRQIVPQEIACKIGCRGTKCKYDNGDWPSDQMVLKGLYSNWYVLLS